MGWCLGDTCFLNSPDQLIITTKHMLMEKKNKGEYLAPNVKVVEMACAQLIATSGSVSANSIEDTNENAVIDW